MTAKPTGASKISSPSAAVSSAEARVAGYPWQDLTAEIDARGCGVMERLLTPEECRQLAGLYPDESRFRSHIHMARHGFGKGEYRYFRYPLPDLIADLRTALYPRLADIANDWNGVVVTYVAQRSAAADKGLRAGLVIVAVGTRSVEGLQDFSQELQRTTAPEERKPLLLLVLDPQNNAQATLAIPHR